jgi:NADH dehydrogenase
MKRKKDIHMITGAFGFSGKYIAQRLLDRGADVHTLTHSIERVNPFGKSVIVHPFNFDKPDLLKGSLEGVKVLYNTYWVRFNHRSFNHREAVENSKVLFNAAKGAGVKRIVHVSITNPSASSSLEYFSGKAEVEEALVNTGISYSILRPAVLFGREDILINNIAWALRKSPFLFIFGDGNYRLQPVYVDDLARLAVEMGERNDNIILNAIGPETFTYRELVKLIGSLTGKNRPLISVPPGIGYLAGKLIGWCVNDIVITKEEIEGLMDGLLYVNERPAGDTKLSEWVREHAGSIGRRYSSELSRRRDRLSEYDKL